MRAAGPERSAPELTVVVACADARSTIVSCVAAFRQDAEGAGVDCEILVVDASRDGSPEVLRDSMPDVAVVSCPAGSLVPELWSAGARRARGAVVGLTTAACVPEPGWVAAMLAERAMGAAAVGGPITCDPEASLVDRAIFLTRYSAYTPPPEARDAEDLPGDNAAYAAEALHRFPRFLEGPFWEPFLHAEMRAAGLRLRFVPGARVRYVHSIGALRFLAQRFRHGWHFGAMRAAGESRLRSFARAVAFPLVPFVLGRRIAGRLHAHPGTSAAELLAVAPLALAFLTAFAAGECSAALRASLGRKRTTERW